MTIDYQDFCRTGIEFCHLDVLKKLCADMREQNVVFIMSKSAARRYLWEDAIKEWQKRGRLLWISDFVSYPTQETLMMGMEKMKGFCTDVIIAVGGGSSIDFAKGMKAFYGRKEDCTVAAITECLMAKKMTMGEKNIRLIAIPTTAGTGAELTQWATIWDARKQCKYSLDHPALKPDKAIIIPELTAMADEKLTISTALDALAHAVEAYWAKKANPLVRSLASAAIREMVNELPELLKEPENLYYREKQCTASVLAGLAFSMTRTTACHSISYPLTMHYGIPHGIAAAMTLEKVAERNSGSYPEETALMDLFRAFGGIGNFLRKICSDRVSLFLKDYGIKKSDIFLIVQKAFTLGRMDNNPKELCSEDVESILCEIYKS